jgi:hypothetical protein
MGECQTEHRHVQQINRDIATTTTQNNEVGVNICAPLIYGLLFSSLRCQRVPKVYHVPRVPRRH